MVLSKGKTWQYVGITSFKGKLGLIFLFLLLALPAFASGGACPTGATYGPNNNATLSSLGVTSCYYISAAGADTNTGTDETHPWLHAPQMPNCSGNCATVQSGGIPAGTGIILRGGDTWHFGNSSASPYTGGTWDFNTSPYPSYNGTSAHPIYLGVDQTWYTGSSWARPILTGDGNLCGPSTVNGTTCISGLIPGSSTITQYYVSSCPYQISSSNNVLELDNATNYIVDNFEMTGICLNSSATQNAYIRYGSLTGPVTFLSLYIHGWTHTAFSGPNGSCSGVCWGILAFWGGGAGASKGETLKYVIVDGADSDGEAGGFLDGGGYNVGWSVIRYTSQGLVSNMHLFHDSIYEYFYENGHSNMWESTGPDNAGTNAVYNNLFRHLEVSGGYGGEGFNTEPPTGTTDYFFNNIWYDVGSMEEFNLSPGVGTTYVANNTIDWGTGNTFGCPGVLTAINNHYLTEGSSVYGVGGGGCTLTASKNIQMNHATATSDGYATSETYVFSPTTSNSPTVGAGTNEQSAMCAALSTAAGSDPTLSDAAAACSSDTRYSCTYNTSNHTVSCPARTAVARPPSEAWDVGAYQLTGMNPPTNLTATVQ
jgi:hypothetical protein